MTRPRLTSSVASWSCSEIELSSNVFIAPSTIARACPARAADTRWESSECELVPHQRPDHRSCPLPLPTHNSRRDLMLHSVVRAEEQGFEPWTQVSPGNRLAGGRTRPLCDSSIGRHVERKRRRERDSNPRGISPCCFQDS